MITEDYCSYDVAELLNEKGFEIDTNKDYWKIGEDGTMYFMSSIGAYTSNPHSDYAFYRPENSYPCPTHQMAMKWLREKGVYMSIDTVISSSGNIYFNIDTYSEDSGWNHPVDFYDSYEEAVEAALEYCLQNLI